MDCLLLLDKFILLPRDKPIEKKRKRVVTISTVAAVAIIAATYHSHNSSTGRIICIVTMVCNTLGLLFVVIKKSAPEVIISALLLFTTITILLLDSLSMVTHGTYMVSIVVLLLDIALACNLKKLTPIVILAVTTIQQFVMAAEGAFHFGISDFYNVSNDEKRIDCDCENPPCVDVGGSLGYLLLTLFVFYFDFYFTRSFADSVIKENEKIESSIEITNSIAIHIAAFEIEEACAVLQSATGLPPGIVFSLDRVLDALTQYKPYLPQSCFCNDHIVIDDSSTCISSALSSAKSTSVSLVEGSQFSTVKAIFTKCFATLLVTNFRGSLILLQTSIDQYTSLHSITTDTAISVFGKFRGVVELFIGDRFHVSFNAVKQKNFCHATSAVKGAVLFRKLMKDFNSKLSINISVSTGALIGGDLGSYILRRFTEIGRPATEVFIMERFGRKFNYSLLCSRRTSDECDQNNLFLLPNTIWCCGEETLLFELTQNGQELLLQSINKKDSEWMYHLSELEEDAQKSYNKDMMTYLKQSLLPFPKRDRKILGSIVTDMNEIMGPQPEEDNIHYTLRKLISSLRQFDSPQRSPYLFDFQFAEGCGTPKSHIPTRSPRARVLR